MGGDGRLNINLPAFKHKCREVLVTTTTCICFDNESMGSIIKVVSFGSPQYQDALLLLKHTALDDGLVDEVTTYTAEDLNSFFDQNPDFSTASRGWGYWSWKAHIIAKELKRFRRDDDVLIWCDAAMTFERPVDLYAHLARDDPHGACLFALPPAGTHRVSEWTKPSVKTIMGATDEEWAAPMVNAALQVYTKRALPLVEEYATWSVRRDVMQDEPEYLKHRHDQSVLSILAAKWGLKLYQDATQFGDEDRAGGEPALVNHHRKAYPRGSLIRCAVITATRGGRHLEACIRSVQAQTLPGVCHYVVADGKDCAERVASVVKRYSFKKDIRLVVLPLRTGMNTWNGHRIYGSMPWLIPDWTHYVSFLDDDNTMSPDHLLHLTKLCLDSKASWAFSLRSIHDKDGTFITNDNCESLGSIHHSIVAADDFLVDTSCYLIERSLAIKASPCWDTKARPTNGEMEVDRRLCRFLLSEAPHVASRRYSVQYRVDSTASSVSADFFIKGNSRWKYDFGGRQDIYLFHFSAQATEAYFEASRGAQDRSFAMDEWQMTLHRELERRFNVLNGYEQCPNLPPNATVLCVLCHPQHMPLSFLQERTDLKRLVYTAESPNIRHAKQWTKEFLTAHFDIFLTYWEPLLTGLPARCVMCPHNTHHLDFENPLDVAQLRTNMGPNTGSVVFVGENRPHLSGEYEIDGLTMRCCDPYRSSFVAALATAGIPITVIGTGWQEYAGRYESLKIGSVVHRSQDPKSSVDHYVHHDFVLVIENTVTPHYASEKLYDALLAGAICLYMGSAPPFVDDDLFVDISHYQDEPAALAARIKSIIQTPGCIEARKAKVAAERAGILKRVSCQAFADAVQTAIATSSP